MLDPAARVVLQRCRRARLQAAPHSQWLQIGRGLVVYVCFLKDATADVIPKMVNELMRLRVCESTDGHLVRLPELPGSLLIVPQATLGGRSKAGRLQYHGNACRAEAEALFAAFAEQCGVALQEQSAPDSGSVVLHGTYGSRQMLELESDGPGTSLLEF